MIDRARAPAGAVLLTLTLALGGCPSRATPKPAPSAKPGPSAAPTAKPSATTAKRATPGCRILAVKAPTPAPPGTPAVGDVTEGTSWLDIAAGVELSLKHAETTRELTLKGPARVLACGGGQEVVHVAKGSVRTTAGPGAHAGATFMLATPFAVVEYADAALALEVGADKLVLDVTRGAAIVGATTLEEAPQLKIVRPSDGRFELAGQLEPGPATDRCVERTNALREGGPAAAPNAGASRGQWAKAMVEKRQAARLLCSRARAAVGTLEGPERTRLEDLLAPRNLAPRATALPSAEAETDAGK